MGHDDKVKNLTVRTKQVFLKEVFKAPAEKPHVYDLDTEFAKTRKNPNFIVPLSILGFLVVVGLTTWTVMRVVNEQNRKLAVDIGDFQDINLSGLLGAAKQNETRMESLRSDLAGLDRRYEAESERIRTTYRQLREKLLSRRLNTAQEKKELALLEEKETEEIRTASERRTAQREKAKGEITLLQTEIDAYDKRLQDVMKKAQSAVNNIRQLMDIKLAKQREDLLSAYDPVFPEAVLRFIRQAPPPGLQLSWKDWFPAAEYENAVTQSGFDGLRRDAGTTAAITAKLKTLPHRNSLADSFSALETLLASQINLYEETLERLSRTVSAKNSLLDSYQYAVEDFLSRQTEVGLVLDGRRPERLRIRLNRLYPAQPGQTAAVFRSAQEPVGRIRFLTGGVLAEAEIIELAADQTIRPFDRVILQETKE